MSISYVKNLLLGILFLLPLLGAYKGFGYEQIKVLFFVLSITLIGFLWKGKGFKWTLISKIAGLFILILLITSLSGLNYKNSLLGIQPYFQSWILYLYLYFFYLMGKTFNIELKKYALVLSASASIVAFLAVYDWVLLNILNQQIPTYAGRVVSTFGQPNFYAGFILLTLPFFRFLLGLKADHPQRWWLTLGFLISITALILSQSRTAYLLLALLMLLWLTFEMAGKRVLVFGTVLAALVVVISFSIFLSSGILWKEIIEPNLTENPDLTKSSVENRVYIWPVALQLILQKPLLGYGLENINKAFQSYFITNKHAIFEENLQIYPVWISLKDLNIDRTHNYILDLVLFSGILGLISWLFLIIIIIRKLILSPISSVTTTLLIGLFIYLTWVQFQNQSVVHLVYFWLLVGIIDSD